jgi:hypothetical protein
MGWVRGAWGVSPCYLLPMPALCYAAKNHLAVKWFLSRHAVAASTKRLLLGQTLAPQPVQPISQKLQHCAAVG